MGLETEQTSSQAHAVIAAQSPGVIRLQNAFRSPAPGRAASSAIDAPRYLSATRKPWCERPHRFRRGATPRVWDRGRSHHGLLSITDAVAF